MAEIQKQQNSEHIPESPVAFVASITRPHMGFAVSAFIFATIASVSNSALPLALKYLVDATLVMDNPSAHIQELLLWIVLYLGLFVVSSALWRTCGFIGMEWLTRAHATASKKLYSYVSLHSHSYFSNRFAGSISSKISHASDGSRRLMEDTIWQYYPGLISLVVAIYLIGAVHIYLGGIYIALIILLTTLNSVLVVKRNAYVVAASEASSALSGVGVDMLTNIGAVRQYAKEKDELSYIGTFIEDSRVKHIKEWRKAEWSLVFNGLFIALAFCAIVAVIVRLFARGEVSVGDVVLVVSVIAQSAWMLEFIGMSMGSVVRTYGEIREGLQDIAKPYEITDMKGAQDLSVEKGAISFNAVSFSYENQKVFESLNLHIAPGERVGLVGTSGAGKTTLVSLLLRQHDISEGTISIDGQNIAEVTQGSLRTAIAVVPQDSQLFHRTIKENITYGKSDATDEEMTNAARMAYAEEFVDVLPQKYDTLVGERGVKLSGGQRQRVVIARAILKNAPILVLDEATSALDSASEVVIQKALHALMEGKTVIAIAHRLSTLREMDRIVVLDKGSVVESGTHDELVKLGGIYAGLWGHQVGGFIQEE